ncbi:MAG TPA: cyclic nucleotide-binding domain-containing protein, partial [Solimonas sp.]|nr:cyclic nucleotide-binding domain-containing protein [Solimonas sp.]
VNRRGEFARAKDANSAAILEAIGSNQLQCYYNCGVEKVEARPAPAKPLLLRLNSKDGNVEIACDRIIGRLGATPPREFVEACGIAFPSKDPNSIPAVSARYESNVPGLYVVGALAGYPLIKQALNQGYEVVEMICGRPVAPADEPILKEKFAVFSGVEDVEVVLDVLKGRMAWIGALTTLQLREFLLESRILAPAEGEVLYEKDDYSNSVYSVLAGEVKVRLDPKDPTRDRTIKAGRIFGEMALVSGRRRSATLIAGKGARLIEIPRRAMIKLINSQDTVRAYVDRVFALRALQTYLAPEADEAMLKDVLATATLRQFKAQDPIYKEGDPSEDIHLIRSGSVMLSIRDRERDVVLAYVAAGQYFGELDVIAGTPRRQSARAAIKTETISIKASAFMTLLDANPGLREAVRGRFRERINQRLVMESAPERGAMMKFLLQEGLGEATDALLIDEALCVRCDQCEKACAATHGNVSRLDREAGATYDNLHVPTSCRHCEHPHCMKDCPPDAIHRAPNGEVYIEDTCIGCGNCERNCPYGVIQMGVQTSGQPSLWRWMLTGAGRAPGTESHDYPKDSIKKAVKCDMCRERAEGPACVQACPTGAAIRVGPEDFFQVLAREGR